MTGCLGGDKSKEAVDRRKDVPIRECGGGRARVVCQCKHRYWTGLLLRPARIQPAGLARKLSGVLTQRLLVSMPAVEHEWSLEEVFKHHQVDSSKGLSSTQVAALREKHGWNRWACPKIPHLPDGRASHVGHGRCRIMDPASHATTELPPSLLALPSQAHTTSKLDVRLCIRSLFY